MNASSTPGAGDSNASQSDSNPESRSPAKNTVRIGSQRDLADKSLSPQHPQAVRRASKPELGAETRGPTPSDTVASSPSPADGMIDQPSEPAADADSDLAMPPRTEPPSVDSTNPTDPSESSLSLDEEIEAALGGMSIEQLMSMADDLGVGELAPESRLRATVTRIHADDVFFKLSGRFEGVASLRTFSQAPQIGQSLDVVVKRFNEDEGLYAVAIPGAAIDVGDWSDLVIGAVVEARVTGTNTGGLEAEVNRIRGFIPASQVALYRVEQFSDFVNQKLTCVVTDADPERKRLVLSRRAVLEREQAAKREELLKTLQTGQTLTGVVTKLMDFGAFVDIGGMEGLVHVSKLSWDRVGHPSEVLKVGEKIKVKVERIAEGSGKLSLSYRDTLQDPWENIEQKYPANSTARGTVSRIAQFGAFVKLEPGVEGLVHISELAHHRVFAVKNVVNEGDEVEVKILSIDRAAQRMSLSLKATQTKPEPKSADSQKKADEDAPPRPVTVPSRNEPLKGGRDRKSGGENVGLNW